MIVGALLVLNISLFLAPVLIFTGYEDAASWLYNFHSYDHQWIYRSECLFKDTYGGFSVQDCIVQGKENESKITTLYTQDGDPRFKGVFSNYPQNQIGRNKAEKVERNGMVGYKFANDTRDYAIYLPWFIVMALYPFAFGRRQIIEPKWWLLVLALVPMGIDGTTQLIAAITGNPSYYWLSGFGLNESTNLLRWITGGIAGIAGGYFTVALFYCAPFRKGDKKDGE